MISLYLLNTDLLFTTCLSQRRILRLLEFDSIRADIRGDNR